MSPIFCSKDRLKNDPFWRLPPAGSNTSKYPLKNALRGGPVRRLENERRRPFPITEPLHCRYPTHRRKSVVFPLDANQC